MFVLCAATPGKPVGSQDCTETTCPLVRKHRLALWQLHFIWLLLQNRKEEKVSLTFNLMSAFLFFIFDEANFDEANLEHIIVGFSL